MSDKKNYTFQSVSSVLSVKDIEKSKKYYVDNLLFDVGFEWKDDNTGSITYVILYAGDFSLHLQQSDVTSPSRVYFHVKGVKDYYQMVEKKGANITDALKDQPWKMREFEVADLDGHKVLFGQEI